MTPLTRVDEPAALTWLRHALADFYIHDHALMSLKVGERALSFRIGHHLIHHVTQDWIVDAEYDRQAAAGAEKRRATGRTMQPDLVIHRRGMEGETNNLLFVEIKRKWSQPLGNRDDLAKACDAITMHNYQLAVVLGLSCYVTGSFSPHWTVLSMSRDQDAQAVRAAPIRLAEPVFTDAEISQLTEASVRTDHS